MSARRDLLHAGSCAWVAVASGLNSMACWRMLDQSTASSVAGILSLPPFGIPDSEPMLRTVFSLSLCVSALDGGAAAPLCLRELAEYRPAVPEPEPTPTLETERCG